MSAKITKALHEVMSKCGYVQKTGKNAFHGYKYAGEADLLEVLRPAMVEAGLLLIPSIAEVRPIDEYGNSVVIVEYTLAHKDGDVWPHPIRAAGAGNDKNKNGIGDKGVYKALTGANKYLLFKLFQIETGDDAEAGDSRGERAPGWQSKYPNPESVESGTPLRDAHNEITRGEASTVAQRAAAGALTNPSVGDPKAWASSADAADFLRGARADLGMVNTGEGLARWVTAFRWQQDAILEYGDGIKNKNGASRSDLLNTWIGEAQDRCRAPVDLRAAG